MIHVLIDDRERGSAAATCLMENPGVHAEVKRLKTGDYQVEGLVVERKTLRDFAASILDGRLFRQGERLAACGRSLLILEGGAREAAAIGHRREALQGALITLSLLYAIPVLRSLDGAETAKLILYSARQLARNAIGLRRSGRRPKGKRALQLRILQGLPRIGPRRATALLQTFETVLGVMQAGQAEWEAVDGIGPRVAKGMVWAVREPKGGYYCDPMERRK